MDKNAYNCYLINFLGFILVPFTPGTRHFCSGPAESGKIWKGTSMNFDYFFLRRNLCILFDTPGDSLHVDVAIASPLCQKSNLRLDSGS